MKNTKEATPLGKYMRKLRVDNEDTLRTLGQKLGISAAYLSAVEIGHVHPARKWLLNLKSVYNLDESQMDELYTAYMNTRKKFYVDYGDMTERQVQCGNRFLKLLPSMSDEDLNKVFRILSKVGAKS